jgi:hypothetical protein
MLSILFELIMRAFLISMPFCRYFYETVTNRILTNIVKRKTIGGNKKWVNIQTEMPPEKRPLEK